MTSWLRGSRGGGASRNLLALCDFAAVNIVRQVGISTLSELSKWSGLDSNADSNGTQFVGVQECSLTTTEIGVELRRRDTRGGPRRPKTTLGVKWSQVQILSARPR